MRVKLPKLLNAEQKPYKTLHPVKESITQNKYLPNQATMTLPDTDPDVKLHDLIRLYTADGDEGVYRVTGVRRSVGTDWLLDLTHGFCVLAADKPQNMPEELSGTLYDVLNILWSAVGVTTGPAYWEIGRVPDTPVFTYRPKNENLMTAIYSAVKAAGNFVLRFEQPNNQKWVFHIDEADSLSLCEGRFSRNLNSVEINEDDYDLVTRVYVQGRDGTWDADTIDVWGVFTETLSAAENVTEESLDAYVRDYLNAHKNPRISISADAIDLSSITGEKIDSFVIGRRCRACLPKYGVTVTEEIVSKEYPDVYGEPRRLRITMCNQPETTPDLLRYTEEETAKAGRRAGGAMAMAEQSNIELIRVNEVLDDTRYRMRMAGIVVDGDAEFVKLFAYQETVDEQSQRIRAAEIELDSVNAKIDLLTGSTDITDLAKRVSNAEIAIDGLNADIQLKASIETTDLLTNEVETLAAELRVQAEEIKGRVSSKDFETALLLKADRSSLTTLSNSVNNRFNEQGDLIAGHGTQIQANSDAIALRAVKDDVDAQFEVQAGRIESAVNKTSALEGRMSTAESTIVQQGNLIASKVAQSEFTALGERVSDAESSIEQQANLIKTKVAQSDFDALGERVKTAESGITQQASKLDAYASVLDAYGNRINSAELVLNGSSGEAGLISRVENAESSIIAQGNQIRAKADLILLEGYVKADELEAEVANINRFFSGETYASSMGISGNLYAQNVNFPGNVSLLGRVTNLVSLTMGDVASHTFFGAGTGTSVDLSHSHKVSVSDSGTVTLGEVSSTGGSFKIADTKFYKEAVSAAYDTARTDWTPVAIERSDYDTAAKTVTVRALNAVGVPVLGLEVIDASEIYDQGRTDWQPDVIVRTGYSTANKTVTVRAENAAGIPVLGLEVIDASEIWNDGNADGYANGKTDWSPASIERYDYSLSGRTVSVRVLNAAGVPVISGDISANEIYNWGYIEGDKSSGNYSDGYNAGKLDWNPVSLVRYDYSASGKTVSVRALNAAGVPVIAGDIDASEIYNMGRSDWEPSKISRTGYSTTDKTVTVIAVNAAGETVLTNQVIDASEIYNAGVAAGGDGEGGYDDGYNAGKLDWNPVSLVRYDYSVSAKTVSVRAVNAADVPVIAGTIDASEIYTAGADEVILSQSGWLNAKNTVTASNGETETINLPPISFEESDWMGDDPYKMIRVSITEADGSKNLIRSLIVYSNGVSGDVTLSQTGWTGNVNVVSASNGKQVSVLLPAFATSVDAWNSLHKTYARFYSTNADGSLQFQRYAEVDATSVYEAGAAESLPTSITRTGYSAADKTVTVKASNDQGDLLTGIVIDAGEIYAKGQSDWSPSTLARYSYSTTAKTVSVRALNAAGVPVIAGDINASEIWQAGYDAASDGEGGYDEGYAQGKTDWMPARINRPAYDVEKKTITVRATNAIGVPLISAEVIASEIWDAGSDDGYARGKTDWVPVNLERTGYSTSEKTVTVRAANAAEVPLISGDIDASEIWDAGSTDGYARGKTDWTPVSLARYDYSTSEKTVSVRAVNAADVPVIGGTIDASEIWQAGFEAGEAENSGYDKGYDEGYAQGKTDWVPVKIERSDYSTSAKTVTVRALNGAGVPVLGLETIDASEIWQAGYEAGAAENGGYDEGYEAGRAAGYEAGYAQGKTDWAPVSIERSGYSTSGKTVTVRALNAAGVPVLGLETISASEIFNSGYSYGHDDGWSEAEDNVTIGYDIDGQRLSTYRVLITGVVWADLAGKTVATGSINRTLSV